jgi:uncharacterized protein
LIYLDTSALIKRYIWESGSEIVQRLFKDPNPIAVSKIAYAEAYAALTRRWRDGHLKQVQYDQACRLFEREWPAYVIVEVEDDILRLARDLIRKYPLRGFDALHLASAKSLLKHLRAPVAFACADRRLLDSAEAEGFQLIAL